VLVRKTVTVLFCDVTESTRLGESLDPETHRRVMSRYFEEMSAALEAHGGTVEKFIGDAVMAVFGVPTVHEDDALRAVRAAAEMRQRLARLNTELEPAYGVVLQMRIGVNTGEVVAGDSASGHSLVTGDAVVVAKRLEEAAPPGEILIGKATYPLVQNAIDAGPLQTFSAKGKSERVPSRRVDDVRAGAGGIARRLDAPLVGRDEELAGLLGELERVRQERSCRLVTLLGPAGIGKSRLARELLDAAAGATTLSGRCLPYGEGITYWPLAELVRAAGGEAAVRATLSSADQGELAAERVLGAIGVSDSSASTEETFWGVRRYLEALAAEKPLVLCLEDVHWAEPTLLDLLDYLAGWMTDSPVLLLCLARPDLLERRPAWSAPRENAAIVALEPLSDAAVAELLADLPSGAELGPASLVRIAEAGEGNPLFLEQLMAMAAESGDGETAPVPPSVQAVIAERLDRLDAHERAVVECAAVVGKEFVRGAVVELASAEARPTVGGALRELVRKGLVRPHVSPTAGEDGFRFGHVLIRDVAYEAMPKQLRAELHERFPDWIERNAGDRGGELEEIVAYHLEQAHRYRMELGPADERSRELAARASELLGRAGSRAFAQGDMPAAVTLLERALALGPADEPRRAVLLTELGSGLMKTGEFDRAGVVLEDAIECAQALGDRRTEVRATIERQFQRSFTTPEGAAAEDRRIAEAAILELEEMNDPVGLAKAWWLLSESHAIAGRWAARAEALEQALAHSARAPDASSHATVYIAHLAQALYLGPTPVGEAIARCEELRAEERGPALEAALGTTLAALYAMEGRFEEARSLYADSAAAYERLGLRFSHAARSYLGAHVEALAGDLEAAAAELRSGCETLEAMGERGVRSALAGLLGDVLAQLGHEEEAERHLVFAEAESGAADLVPQVAWRRARARILARRDALDDALELAREAERLAAGTDHLDLRADTGMVLAELLDEAGNDRAAASTRAEALALYARKGNVVAAGASLEQMRAPRRPA
jgi:class 3 adenylate cyclase